ncbi:MAG: hypothetical protein JWR35_3730 [Marmoricola sp.]|nr:hypothetical protein [Marmoricola sp.]
MTGHNKEIRMTTTLLRPTTTRTSVDAPRKHAFAAGVFYLVTFFASIPAVILLNPVLNDAHYVVGAGADTRVTFACLLDVINALAGIGSAVALFSVVKRQHEGLALGLVMSRMFEAAVIMIGVVCLLGIVTLRQDGPASGADQGSLIAAAQSLVAVRNWTLLLGPGVMAAINGLQLGTLMYRSRLVPRVIPTIGLIGVPVLLASCLCTLFGVFGQFSPAALFFGLPIATWEFSLGCYLVVKGFRPAALAALSSSATAA